jgi:hypothetical protein
LCGAQAGAYTSQQLRDAFAAHGRVEDVILRGSRKKSKVGPAGALPASSFAAALHVTPCCASQKAHIPESATRNAVMARCRDAAPHLPPVFWLVVQGSALVVMGTRAAAAAAAATSHGDPANALLVVPFLKVHRCCHRTHPVLEQRSAAMFTDEPPPQLL